MAQTRTTLTLKLVAVDIVGRVLYFPMWWYSAGFFRIARWCGRRLSGMAENFGIGIWLKNLFTPMYGQRDIAGRLISFVLRTLTIIFYTVLLAMYAVLLMLVLLAWLVVPVFVVWSLGFQAGFTDASPI